ncbi:TetR/AcrR family transcriptional regulator [Nocardioides sp. zg-DK7169]|uniref:TetR/AcrR family transcriptional regulator n=1 Tax=Nocardioides sp. zg-DK7169 TaxID=2736600 RepID=UPI0015579062|nr:TetR/AcrR family transcriptional regulator [Nocardioides sp. zg-DK7169]NPC96676.1 TetR/AcrR family transcriptional regulator [Nocardioides sp. zg-DK7169]
MDTRARPGRRELNKLQTRERLLGATRELLAEVGAVTTVEEIAERAGVSRATFFNYFASKDDLLAELYAALLAQMDEVVEGLLVGDLSTEERVVGVFADFGHHARERPSYLLAFTSALERVSTSEQVAERSDRLAGLFARVLEPGLAAGEVRTDHPVPFLARMVSAIYIASLRQAWGREETAEFAAGFERAGRFAAEAVLVR